MQQFLHQVGIRLNTSIFVSFIRKYWCIPGILFFINSTVSATPSFSTTSPDSINESSVSKLAVTVQATGTVSTDAITYSITGGLDSSNFVIDPVTGDLSFKFFPDYERPGGRDVPTGGLAPYQIPVSAWNTYQVTVTATDNNDNSTNSLPLTITVKNVDENPDPPRDLYVISQDRSNILNWTASASLGSISEYRIYRSTDSVTWSNIASVSVGTTTYTDNNLTNGKFYFYYVTAWNGVSESVKSNVDASTPDKSEITRYMHFDGSSSYLVVKDTNKLMVVPPFAATTLECWVRLSSLPATNEYILSKDYNGSLFTFFELYYDATYKNFVFQYRAGPPGTVSTYQVTSNTIVKANTWYHIAVTHAYPNDFVTMYINGIYDAQSTNNPQGETYEDMPATNPLYPAYSRLVIGAHTSGISPFIYTSFFDGDIAEVSLWYTKLDSATIHSNMYTRRKGDETGLLGLWHLDTLFNNVVYDYDNLNFNAVAHGNVSCETAQTTAVNDTVSVPASSLSYIDVKANDTYSGLRQNTRTKIVSGPSHGAASVINLDSISYNPGCFVGTDTIKYLICDTTFFNNPYQHADTAIAIITVEDNPPVITSNGGGVSAALSINENTTAVTTVTATDVEACQTKTYSVSGGPDKAKFSIDSFSGVLRFINAPDYESPADVDSNNVYDVTVQVSDGFLVDTQAVAVTVLNVNEPPTITSSSTVNVPENTTSVMTVTSSDPDAGDTKTYSITGGADQGKFTINSTTGALSFITAPNYELPGDANGDNNYIVSVTVTDGGGLTNTMPITVTVTNVNEPPTITSSSTANVPENTTSVMTMTSSDPDAGDTKTYSITGGADQGKFMIDSTTGALSFISAPNYESPGDANNDNIYNVDVAVTDGGGLADTMAVAVTVTNVNEAPTITSLSTASVPENTTSVMTVTSSDPDAGDTKTYSITGGADQGKFTINSTTGALSFITAPNYELPGDANGDNNYIVSVTVTDGGGLTNTMPITVTVTNVNEAPTITSSSTANVPENTTSVMTMTSSDPDAGDTKTYSITGGADQGKFMIDSTTGALSFITAPNYELPGDANNDNIYNIDVAVTDGGGLADTMSIAVTVTNVNESPTITSSSTASIPENTTPVMTVTSSDPDAGDTKTYSITGGTDQGKFTINSTTGALSFISAPNYDIPGDANGDNNYNVSVTVTDGGGLTNTMSITVTVTNVNEAPTDISLSNNNIDENLPVGTVIGILSTTDPDAGDIFTYSFVAGGDEASFTLSGDTLRSAGVFHYAVKSVYAITVRSTDAGGLSYDKPFTITINQTNNPPTNISLSNDTVDENQSLGILIGTLSTADVDAGDTHSYSFVSGSDQGYFSISGDSLKTNAVFDYETKASYSFTIRTTDSHGASFDKAFTISINNINDAPTDISLSNDQIKENLPANTLIGILSTTDQDVGDTHTYSFVPGGDEASFILSGDTLRSVRSFDYEARSTYSITIRSTDSQGAFFDKTFSIDIINVNDAPQFVDQNGNPITYMADSVPWNRDTQICLNATDEDGNKVTIGQSSSLTGHGITLKGAHLCFTYRPDKNFLGTDTARVIISDNGAPVMHDTLYVILHVYPVNSPPVILNKQGVPSDYLFDTTWEDTPLERCIDVFDYDSDRVFIFGIRSITGHSRIDWQSDSDLCFLATPDSGFYGTDSIRIIVSDDGTPVGYDTAIMVLYVKHVNRPPVILNENGIPADTLYYKAYANEQTQVCLRVYDPDNDEVSIGSIYSLRGNGTMTVQNNTTCLDYNPETDFLGLERFFVKVCDNGVPSLCDSAIIVMDVRPKFIIPQAISPNGDGVNDRWIIDGIENYPDNTVIIFSRWGDIVYKAKGYNNVSVVWNGEFTNGSEAGKQVPDGTYFYEIILNGKAKLSGYVVLKR